jgi:hypothetical protein
LARRHLAVKQFEASHPIGSKARLAMALMLYTGQAGLCVRTVFGLNNEQVLVQNGDHVCEFFAVVRSQRVDCNPFTRERPVKRDRYVSLLVVSGVFTLIRHC